MDTNLGDRKSYDYAYLFANQGICKLVIVVLLCLGTLMACGGQPIIQAESATSDESVDKDKPISEVYKDIRSHFQGARRYGFVNCGVFDKPECRIYQEKFSTIAVETIIESQGADSLVCCVTRITLNKKEQNCTDLSMYTEQLKNRCPQGWWETRPRR